MRGHDTSRMLVAIGQSYVSSVQSVCVFQYRPAGCFLCLGRMDIHGFKVVPATARDRSLIANFITAFADEHRMNGAVRINECRLTKCLLGTERTAEAFIGYQHDDPVSYTLFFTDFSSFTVETGLYLEDLYVRPEAKGSGIGGQMLRHLAKLAALAFQSAIRCFTTWRSIFITRALPMRLLSGREPTESFIKSFRRAPRRARGL